MHGGMETAKDKNKEIDYLKSFLNIFLKILRTKGFSLRRVGISLFRFLVWYPFKSSIFISNKFNFIYKIFKIWIFEYPSKKNITNNSYKTL